MNIFLLDEDPRACAQAHVDRHVVKMILESTQILSAVLHTHGTKGDMSMAYKKTHARHPCTLWAGASLDNWLWLKQFVVELNREKMYRYGKAHKSAAIAAALPTPRIRRLGITEFAQAMPTRYHDDDPIMAYRSYYCGSKSHLFSWTRRGPPDWLHRHHRSMTTSNLIGHLMSS